MTTHTFDELDERGKENAMRMYHEDQAVTEWLGEWQEAHGGTVPAFGEWEAMKRCAIARGWRFNIHGERVA